jgi:AraC-like DNA-binding protein
VRALAQVYPAGNGENEHTHDGWHQLVYAATGFFGVHTPAASWVVPPARGVWVPAGVAHRLTTRTRTLMHTIYVAEHVHAEIGGLAELPDHAHVVHVTPLVRELIAHVVRHAPLGLDRERDRHVVALLLDQLTTLEVPALDLPEPTGARALDAAARLRADPALTIAAVTAQVGASRRTLEREFAAPGGLALGRWRRRAQLLRALELLADGASVTTAGTTVGFSTTSAFVAAFRRELGTTPGRFFADAT